MQRLHNCWSWWKSRVNWDLSSPTEWWPLVAMNVQLKNFAWSVAVWATLASTPFLSFEVEHNSSWSPLQRLKDTKKLIKQYSERYQRIVLININYMFKQSSNNLQILTESKDRFLDWAAKHLPPSERPRRIAVVEESYLVRRVAATVLGRLKGFGTPTVHNHTWCPWCELFTFAYSFKDVVDS